MWVHGLHAFKYPIFLVQKQMQQIQNNKKEGTRKHFLTIQPDVCYDFLDMKTVKSYTKLLRYKWKQTEDDVEQEYKKQLGGSNTEEIDDEIADVTSDRFFEERIANISKIMPTKMTERAENATLRVFQNENKFICIFFV